MYRRVVDRHRALAVALLLAATGCSAFTGTDRPAATYEGIEVLATVPQIPGSAGATAWHTAVGFSQPGMGIDDTTYGTAGGLLSDLGQQALVQGGEVRVAFIGAPESDAARAVVQSWGAFSSMLGLEFDFALRKGPMGWYIERVRERSHCHRGATADGSACL